MKKKTAEVISLISVLLFIITSALPGALSSRAYAASGQNAESEINAILQSECSANNQSSVQGLLDGVYSDGAGLISDWMVFAVIQYAGTKYDYTKFARSLREKGSAPSPTTNERFALLFAAMGTNRDFIDSVMKTEVGSLGIMSYIFGLHLMNNGFTSPSVSKDKTVSEILSAQLPDGGWAVSGSNSDVDVTAMAVQSLAPRYPSDGNVKKAVYGALALLSSKQNAEGGYSSYGTENPESCAQVIVALTSLGIDPLSDSRFIKNGKSAVDAMLSFKASDRCYTHKAGGTYNLSATSQVLYSLVALHRFQKGSGRLYDLNAGVKVNLPAPAESTSAKPAGTKAPQSQAPAAQTASPSQHAAVPGTAAQPSTARAGTSTTQRAAAPTFTRRTLTTKPAPSSPAKTTAKETAPEKPATTAKPVSPAKTTAAQTPHGAPSVTAAETVTAAAEDLQITSVTSFSEEGAEFTYTAEETQTAAPSRDKEVTDAQPDEGGAEKERFSLKAAIIIAIWAAAAAASVILLIKKNKKISNYIIIAAVAGVLTGAAAVSDIQWPEDFFRAGEPASGDTVTVTMSIDCKTVAGRGSEEITPADGIILPPTEFVLENGSTAYDCLMLASKEYQIQIEDSTRMLTDHRGAYISGINYLYEFNYGEMSGWMFSVNGDFGDVGCGEYTLSDGDVIEWRYTTNIGDDLK